MKRILTIISAVAALFSVASCNLEKFPSTAINSEEAMESVADCKAFRNGLYSGLKYAFTGAYVYYTDLQTDLFHAVKNFGNWGGPFYSYNVTASEDAATSIWFGLYGYIGNANFLIAGTEKLLASGTLDEADTKTVQQYYGEACYIRAHLLFNLSQYFCEDYDPETAGTKFGVPVVTKYAPTADADKYPHRGTLETTYEQIVKDLDEAEKYVTAAGTVNSAYVTKDVVTALQARVALTMHDYETALLKAKTLIDSGTYKLMSDATAYAKGWVNDNLTETIWRIAMTGPDDYGNTYGYFIYNTTGEEGNDDPQYIPEDWVLDLYDQENDIRYDAYFDEREVSLRFTGTVTLFVKYPGNPTLYSKVSNYAHMPKVFRISEMYLIAAEAAYNIGGQDAVACKYLNDLRSKRIKGYTEQSYNGTALRNEIRDERTKELYGEGFRLNDLKRWHIGFTRSAGQDPSFLQQGPNYAVCTREADDPYFLWPIPEDEIQANPQMKNEQNEAYKR